MNRMCNRVIHTLTWNSDVGSPACCTHVELTLCVSVCKSWGTILLNWGIISAHSRGELISQFHENANVRLSAKWIRGSTITQPAIVLPNYRASTDNFNTKNLQIQHIWSPFPKYKSYQLVHENNEIMIDHL